MKSQLKRLLRVGASRISAATVSKTDPAWLVRTENAQLGTDAWKVRNPGPERAIEGYADHVEIDAGEPFRLFVSTTSGGFTVSAYRMGYYGGRLGRHIWSSGRVPGKLQADPQVSDDGYNTVTAKWDPSLTVDTTGWPEGCYLMRLVSDDGYDRYVPITVRSASCVGKAVWINATSTWMAYNRWGGGWNIYGGPQGSSKDYEGRSRKVSLDRPYDKNGSYFNWYELPMLSLAERIGTPLAFATDLDLHSRPEMFEGCTALIFAGHDEYWSKNMRENALALRDKGANIAFFGANTAYRHVRFEPSTLGLGDERVMVCFKQAAEDPLIETDPDDATHQWRMEPNPRPESVLCGVMYEGNPVDVDFVVVEPDAWMFEGTGVTRGSSFPRLVRVEYDKLFSGVEVPRPIQVLSDSPLLCRGAATFANACYYTVPSGAGVFSTGTLGWTPALPAGGYARQNPPETLQFTRTVSEYVLRVFAQGPAGLRYPAKDNYDQYARPRPGALHYMWNY
jgi:hypothetical protein